MAKIKIEFDCDSASCVDDDGKVFRPEVARILRNLAARIEGHNHPETLHDSNGNRVGKVQYIGKGWK